jgi:hypothetical protein
MAGPRSPVVNQMIGDCAKTWNAPEKAIVALLAELPRRGGNCDPAVQPPNQATRRRLVHGPKRHFEIL